MELKTLRSFVAVAEARSFSMAARELHTVQPAISRHIADLEEEVGVSLFWRNTREVRITPAGESLLRDAKEILASEATAKEHAQRAARGETGRLRIGYLPSACFSFIPDLVRVYSAQYPEVQVALREMSVRQQMEAFAAGQIDVGFSRPRTGIEQQGFGIEEIYRDSLISVLPESHPLASAKSLKLRDLATENFILFKRGEAEGLFDQIISSCMQEDFSPTISSQPENMQTLLTEVASGLGVSIAPGCIRQMYTEGCQFIPIQKQKATILTELHYCLDPLSPTVEAFVEVTMKARDDIQAKMLKL